MYQKKELTGMSYADVKGIAQELSIAISREGGGGRKSKVELVEDILVAQEGGDAEEEVFEDEDEELELEDMTRKELKALAKELGLPIGGSKAVLIDRIAEYYDEDGDEEEDEDDEWEDDDEDVMELTLDDLDDMTVKELKGLAAELGIEKPARRKAQLIDQIVDAAGEDDEEDEDDWDEEEEEDEDVVDYDSLTRKELKALCAARGLPKGGSKAKLVERLEDDDSEVDEPEDDDEPEEEAGDIAAVSGPTGPLETVAADMAIGGSFVLTRVSAEQWTLTPTAGALAPAAGVVSTVPIHDEFGSMARAELKEELRKRGLKVGGRKPEQLARLRAFNAETATTGVTRKFRGRAWKDEVYSDEYKEFVEKSRGMTYAKLVKFAKKKGAKWEKHSDERIDRIRATVALREKLGVEKYKPEYQDQAARAAIKA